MCCRQAASLHSRWRSIFHEGAIGLHALRIGRARKLGQHPFHDQPRRCVQWIAEMWVRTPLPFVDMFNQLCPDRVQYDVTQQFQQMLLLLDAARMVTSLVQVSTEPVAPVEFLRVFAVQVVHGCRKIGIRCLDEQMKVVGHEAQAVDGQIETSGRFFKNVKPDMTVVIVGVDIRTAIASSRNVVDRVLELVS